MKKRVAVVFGGRSPEHDVSIKTGLQALHALDQDRYEGFPLYIALDGGWWTGDLLRDEARYLPALQPREGLIPVVAEPPSGTGSGPAVLVERRAPSIFSRPRRIEFDVALLALHGLNGEDGRLQGYLDLLGIPYTGCRVAASALLMDKAATKRTLAGTGIPMLPFALVERPRQGLIPPAEELGARLASLAFPLIAKPNHLGSSIGVAKVDTLEELRTVLPTIFRFDTHAIIEPCVENLVEYNISVHALTGQTRVSAIEEPKSTGELLDFKQKYLAGGSKGKGAKDRVSSQGMLSLTRDINPQLAAARVADIEAWAASCFAVTGAAGAPRIDFLCDRTTGDIYLNEVNPCPGSFAYFLWEAAREPITFPDLLHLLIEEAFRLHRADVLPDDPTLPEARLFRRG